MWVEKYEYNEDTYTHTRARANTLNQSFAKDEKVTKTQRIEVLIYVYILDILAWFISLIRTRGVVDAQHDPIIYIYMNRSRAKCTTSIQPD